MEGIVTQEIEDRIMAERRKQPMPPTPSNPTLGELRDDLMLEVREGAKRSAQALEAAKRRRLYAALDAISELGSDDPKEPFQGRNPVLDATERRMYTGETADEFYARRKPFEELWTSLLAKARSGEFPV